MATDEDPDYRLRVYLWPVNATMEPEIQFFPWNSWEQAIDYARELSREPEERGLSRLQVVDAMGIQIAQFSPRWFYVPRSGA